MDNRYSFDTFIPDTQNKEAFQSIKKLVDNGGQCVFICGPSTCGKTHLLKAFAAAFQNTYPHRQILYLDIDEFRSLFLSAVHEDTVDDFWNFVLDHHAIVIDNAQYALGMERVIAAVVKEYIKSGKCVLMAGDYLLHDLAKATTSVVTLVRPGFAARYEIVCRNAREIGLSISPVDLQQIAWESQNIRQIEGRLLQEKFRVLSNGDCCG